MNLDGRPAIITGAGSGLGAVVAARLADEGAYVVHQRSPGQVVEMIGDQTRVLH